MKLVLLFASATALLASVPPAAAQATAADRPFRGLFGARVEGAGADQGLDVTATLVQAYDDNLLAETGSISPASPRLGGHYTMLQAGSRYLWGNKTIRVGLTGASAFRYYGRDGGLQTISHTGGVGLTASLARRTTLAINQGAAYSPSYLFGLFPRVGEAGPGDAPSAAPDYALRDLASRSYVTTATVAHGVSKRTSISATADSTFTDFLREDTDRRDMKSYAARAELSRNVGRHTALRTGYRYRTGDSGQAGRRSASEHGVDIGLDHTRMLSPSRQAHVAVAIGVSTTDASLDAAGAARGRFYRLLGDASVDYQFGRSWQANAAYRRGLEYVAELTEPVFVGGLSASVGGLLTRRVDLLVSGGYSSGESALYSASTFDTYTGSLRSRLALRPSVAVYLEYLFYVYDFGADALLAPDLSPRLERHGIRAGLTFWVPAFRR